MDQVRIEGGFWRARMDAIRRTSLPWQYEEIKRTGRLDNFLIAAGLKEGKVSPHLAGDSDVYKWVEAAACACWDNAEPELKARMDEVVAAIEKAQEPGGYINTTFTGARAGERWKDLIHGHEIYTGGHLIQAAVAHHRATGSRQLLNVAVKWADLAYRLFGPGERPGTCGHPEAEMALIELFRETGDRRCLELASLFIQRRGQQPPLVGGSPYLQDHAPIRLQTTPTGHAVRQLYLLSGLTDLFMESGDVSFMDTLRQQWRNLCAKKLAVTGGVGARYQGEAFGADYELPNRTCYNETCASIALAQWAWRMLLASGDAGCADVMERTLFNGALSGVSLDGRTFYYTNPLEHDGGEDLAGSHRGSCRRTSQHWDHTACCPPNIGRTLASMPGCLYGQSQGALWVHHYADSSATAQTAGARVQLRQRTEYPWDGQIEIRVEPEREAAFELRLRVPGWARGAQIAVNGQPAGAEARPGAYAILSRAWRPGDCVTLSLPMPVERLRAHPRVSCCHGRVALARGPVVYCLESADHPGGDLSQLALLKEAEISAGFEPDLLGGVVALRSQGVVMQGQQALYAPGAAPKAAAPADITAVPYFAWANRERGAMEVWIPEM